MFSLRWRGRAEQGGTAAWRSRANTSKPSGYKAYPALRLRFGISTLLLRGLAEDGTELDRVTLAR